MRTLTVTICPELILVALTCSIKCKWFTYVVM